MANVEEVLQYMKELAPVELAEGWDNVGKLVDCGKDVTGILVTLDITDEVVDEAAELGCELIVSHHPVIFDPLRSISGKDVPFHMIKKDISAICMHTNLDAAVGGVNDVLCRLFDVQDAEPFDGLGRVGRVDPITAGQLGQLCRERLGAHVKLVDAGKPIHKLALVGGAGGSMLQAALDAGADALLTGEANHHVALDAQRLGISLVVAGHYCTEFPVVAAVAEKLTARFPELRVLCTWQNKDPYTYL